MQTTHTLPFLKTAAVARALGISYASLFKLIRNGRIAPPARDSSGDYIWMPDDVERAKAALAKRRKVTH